MKKVSVIVPVHNAEMHLAECLYSIKNQSLKEIEIICIDDLSTDNSLNIIKSFVEIDDRFLLLHNEKCMGAGNTRNRGMSYAQGIYIVFWDADEVYCSALLEKMYDAAQKFDADVVLAERGILNTESGQVSPEASRKYQNEKYVNQPFSILDLPDYGLSIWPSSPINRMVRKALIDKYHIQFQDLRSSNDVYYADMSSILASRIIHIDDWDPMIYVRRDLPGSISSNRDPFCSYKAFKKIKDDLIRVGKWKDYHRYVCMHYASAIFVELRKCKNEEMLKKYFYFSREEGFYNICERQDFEYMLFESKYNGQLSILLYSDYRIRCWESNYKIRQLLYDNKDRLGNAFRCFNVCGKQVTLWGCNDWTKEVQNFAKENYKLKMKFITNIEDLHEDLEVLMITNRLDYGVVEKQAGEITKNIQIFVLYEFLCCQSLDKCIKRVDKPSTVEVLYEVLSDDDTMVTRLEKNRDRMKEIFQIIKRNKVRVGIWGENREVEKLIEYAYSQFGYEFNYVVKASERTESSKVQEVPVVSISRIKDDIDMIFVFSSQLMEGICKRVIEENNKIQIFNFYEFLKGRELDNCVKSLTLSQNQSKRNKAFKRVALKIRENTTKLKELSKVFANKRVGLWGAGVWGHELTKYWEGDDVFKLYSLIDNEPALVGCNINGAIVNDFESVYKELDIVIVANNIFYEEIYSQVKSCDDRILIFELYRYLLGEDLTNCYS